jgi:anti-sigma regulatory factor (Ser/Thr protein kinase)
MNTYSTTMTVLPAEAVSAAKARGLVAGAARGAKCLSESDVEDMCVAVGEAFANAVRYGAGASVPAVRFGVELHPGGLRVHMSYPSVPFDTAPAAPDPEDLATGGYGLYLMRALADVVDFRFEDGTARLRLEKHCVSCAK